MSTHDASYDEASLNRAKNCQRGFTERLQTEDKNGCIEIIGELQNLKTLEIHDHNLDKKCISHISKLTELTSLSATIRQIQDVKEWEGLKKLSILSLSTTNPDDSKGAENIGELTSLESLELALWRGEFSSSLFKGVSSLKKLRKLVLIGHQEATCDTEALSHLEKLKLEELALAWIPQFDDQGLKRISQLQHLQSLHLDGLRLVTDQGMAYFSGHKPLTHLNIEYSNCFSEEGIIELASIPNLEKVEASGCFGLTHNALTTLKTKRPDIEIVARPYDVANHEYEVRTLNEILALPGGVQKIYVEGLTHELLEHASRLSSVRELMLYASEYYKTEKYEVELDNLENLALLKNLERLHVVAHTKLNDDIFDHFSSLQNLREIAFYGCIAMTGKKCSELQKLPKLEDFAFDGIVEYDRRKDGGLLRVSTDSLKINDKAVKEITECKTIRALSLTWCPKVSDKGLSYISKMEALERLQLSGCKISNKGLESLSSLPKLNWLHLEENSKITVKGLLYLTKLESLQTLTLLDFKKIDESHIKELQTLMPKCEISLTHSN